MNTGIIGVTVVDPTCILLVSYLYSTYNILFKYR